MDMQHMLKKTANPTNSHTQNVYVEVHFNFGLIPHYNVIYLLYINTVVRNLAKPATKPVDLKRI